MSNFIDELKRKDHKRYLGGLDFFKYIGPGLLVTVGFIDPGNWASNFAAGSEFGYALLWVVTLSTVMLIVLQHNFGIYIYFSGRDSGRRYCAADVVGYSYCVGFYIDHSLCGYHAVLQFI